MTTLAKLHHFRTQKLFMFGHVRIMTSGTLSPGHRGMDSFVGKILLLMALETDIGRPPGRRHPAKDNHAQKRYLLKNLHLPALPE
jgi:hypothetical protein